MEHQPKRFYKRIKDSSTRFKMLPKKEKIKISSILVIPIILAALAAAYLAVTFSKIPEHYIQEYPDELPTQTNPDTDRTTDSSQKSFDNLHTRTDSDSKGNTKRKPDKD